MVKTQEFVQHLDMKVSYYLIAKRKPIKMNIQTYKAKRINRLSVTRLFVSKIKW